MRNAAIVVVSLSVLALVCVGFAKMLKIKDEADRDAKIADRLDQQRRLRRKIEELDRIRNGGAL